MHGVVLCIGYTVASWVGVGFYFVDLNGAVSMQAYRRLIIHSFRDPTHNLVLTTLQEWRVPQAIQCVFPLALACGVMFLPESPRWLIDHGRTEEAFKAFHSTHAESAHDTSSTGQEFEILRQQIKMEENEPTSFRDLFMIPSLRKRCIVGFLTLFAGQATATIVINNYGPILYAGLGYSTVMQLILQGAWISVCPFGNLFNALVVDKTGRTRLMAAGLAGCVLALVGECITVSVFRDTGDQKVAAAAVFFLFLHIGFYSTTMDATSYIYAAEIFPTPMRAKGLAISVSGLFVATIIFLMAAPTAFARIGGMYYIVFIILTSILSGLILWKWPEVRVAIPVSPQLLTLVQRQREDPSKILASLFGDPPHIVHLDDDKGVFADDKKGEGTEIVETGKMA